MRKSITTRQFIGFLATSVGGTLLHFLYDWTNQNFFFSLISGVNESTWEHMKILFFPMFIFAIIEYQYFEDYENFWCIKLIGIVTGLLLIPTLFYTYNGMFGKSPDWINIAIFFLAAAVAYLFETWLFKKDNVSCKSPNLAFAAICLIALAFVVFTFNTPKLPLFMDPITGTYGLQK